MKTSDLIGPALDWAVAKCEGGDGGYYRQIPYYQPSTDWSQGGPIIEREMMLIEFTSAGKWRACIEWLDHPTFEGFGPTPLIAAMRCFVASKLGDTVDVPEELQ